MSSSNLQEQKSIFHNKTQHSFQAGNLLVSKGGTIHSSALGTVCPSGISAVTDGFHPLNCCYSHTAEPSCKQHTRSISGYESIHNGNVCQVCPFPIPPPFFGPFLHAAAVVHFFNFRNNRVFQEFSR